MGGDLTRSGDPDVIFMGRDMLDGPPQMADAKGLADHIGVQGKPEDERLPGALLPHFVKLINDHIGKTVSPDAASDNGGTVIQLLRIGTESRGPERVLSQTGWSSMHQSST